MIRIGVEVETNNISHKELIPKTHNVDLKSG